MHYDLLILGSGSANSIPGREFADQKIALVEEAAFGGTCLNSGCIPTKMFVHTADVARQVTTAARFGLDMRLDGVDWPAIRERIFGRIDPLSEAGRIHRETRHSNMTYFAGHASFVGPKKVEIALADGGREVLTADRIVIATGSRPDMPNVAGLADVGALTNASVMRMEQLPQSMLVLGSGYIAAEMASVFSALGVDVTVVARSGALLRSLDSDISHAYTEAARECYGVVTHFDATRATREGRRVRLTGFEDGKERTLEAETILVATGRIPNADTLNLLAAGIATKAGRISTDHHLRVLGRDGSVVDGVFALGDVSSPHMLKHIANHEMRVVRHNLLNPDKLVRVHEDVVPAAVFGHPQVGTVGLTEEEAKRQGIDYVVGRQKYADIAYGWAMEDTHGFAKVIAERGTSRILGCHIIGPQAATLVQLIVQAMSTGQSARDIVRAQHWIHPAMPELLENALLQVSGMSHLECAEQ